MKQFALIPVLSLSSLLLLQAPAGAASLTNLDHSTALTQTAASTSSDTASEETSSTDSDSSQKETTATASATLRVVEQYNPAETINGLTVTLCSLDTGVETSGTLDKNGKATFNQLPSGIYNLKITDTYGNCILGSHSLEINENTNGTLLVPAALSHLKIVYNNTSAKTSSPCCTVIGNIAQQYELSQVSSRDNAAADGGYIANGTSYSICANNGGALTAQRFLTIPLKRGEFCIRIVETDYCINIQAGHIS